MIFLYKSKYCTCRLDGNGFHRQNKSHLKITKAQIIFFTLASKVAQGSGHNEIAKADWYIRILETHTPPYLPCHVPPLREVVFKMYPSRACFHLGFCHALTVPVLSSKICVSHYRDDNITNIA